MQHELSATLPVIRVLTHRDDLPEHIGQDPHNSNRDTRYTPTREISGVYMGNGIVKDGEKEFCINLCRHEFDFGEPIFMGLRQCTGKPLHITVDATGRKYEFSFQGEPKLKKTFTHPVAPVVLYPKESILKRPNGTLKGVLTNVIDPKTVELDGENGPLLVTFIANSSDKMGNIRDMIGKTVLVEQDDKMRMRVLDFDAVPKRETNRIILHNSVNTPNGVQEKEDADHRIHVYKTMVVQSVTGKLHNFNPNGFVLDTDEHGRVLVEVCRNMVKDIDQAAFLSPLSTYRGSQFTLSVDNTGKNITASVEDGPTTTATFDTFPKIPDDADFSCSYLDTTKVDSMDISKQNPRRHTPK